MICKSLVMVIGDVPATSLRPTFVRDMTLLEITDCRCLHAVGGGQQSVRTSSGKTQGVCLDIS
ncbi:unnamed protein product [Ectocarpus sp. 6 AP-2014]